MTTEDLLKPRIKMIAPIPKIFAHSLEVNQIFEGFNENGFIIFNLTGAHRISLDNVKKYPHLFRILEWWEERKEEEMPEYVKFVGGNKYQRWFVYKVFGWDIPELCFLHEDGNKMLFKYGLPATKEEYENQKLQPHERNRY